MRSAFSALMLPFAAWLGALQATTPRTSSLEDTARFIGIASLLGTLSVLIYRLGVWRQEMENTKNNVGAEVKAYHDGATVTFERLERRLDAIERMIGLATEFRQVVNRRHLRMDSRLGRLEQLQQEQPG